MAEVAGRWGGSREDNLSRQFPTASIAYHPSGEPLASSFGVLEEGRYDSVVYLWDATTGKLRGTLHAEFVSAHPTQIALSPDGRLLAGIFGPALRVWDVAGEMEIAARKPGTKHFKGLAFTPDGRRLVTVSNDQTVRLWDVESWAEVGGFEWKIGNLGAVAVAPDGCRMAAGGSTGKVVIRDAD
jgi:WD40 repeat protein